MLIEAPILKENLGVKNIFYGGDGLERKKNDFFLTRIYLGGTLGVTEGGVSCKHLGRVVALLQGSFGMNLRK